MLIRRSNRIETITRSKSFAVHFLRMDLPQKFSGEVVHGFGRGHKMLGFATANLATDAWTIEVGETGYGVYDGIVHIRGEKGRIGVISVGKNPTFEAKHPTFEVHILDFNEDIYGVVMDVELISFIRPMMQFNGIDSLKEQITKDANKAREHITPLLE